MSLAARRLANDLKELERSPIPYANAMPLSNNIFEWHANVIINDGPYKDTNVHFVLIFSQEYPVKGPKAFFVTPVQYKAGSTSKDDKGRTAICLDLFDNYSHMHSEWSTSEVASGWNSSYSVSTILLQIGSIFSEFMNTRNDYVEFVKRQHIKCECSHDSNNKQQFWPPLPDKIINESSSTNEIICYVTKQIFDNSTDNIFGYCIRCDAKNKSILSSKEFLSRDAFDSGNRRDPTNKIFSHFLPLYISKKHWKNSKKIFEDTINNIFSTTGKPNGQIPFEQKAFSIISSAMNSMVIEVIQKKVIDNKFIDGYTNYYKLLFQIQNEYPKLVDFANSQIHNFLEKPNLMSDNVYEWLYLLVVCSNFEWIHVANILMKELHVENNTLCLKNNKLEPCLTLELFSKINDHTLAVKTFNDTILSRNQICFLTGFLSIIEIFDNITPAVKNILKNKYCEIVKIKNWNEYLQWNKMI